MDNNIDSRIHLYCEKEERLNTLTHGISALIAFVMLIMMAVKVAYRSPIIQGAMLTYCFASLFVYTFSTVYHGTNNIEKKIFWQKIDHSMVSLIVAGTAVPALLVLSKGAVAITMLALVATATVINIALNMISVKKYKRYSQILYLAAVIFIVIGMSFGAKDLSREFWALFIAGFGVIIAGSVFYMQKSKKYTHVIWHIADITTSVLHFLAFYLFVL